ncbi:MAG: LON peptidase substrate-binding domain-containing protein, partial [Hydrogenovibrio sp.]|nr:LON peptidase substrate-binding domain-containing protein [Hydrogenovibrio sp.]
MSDKPEFDIEETQPEKPDQQEFDPADIEFAEFEDHIEEYAEEQQDTQETTPADDDTIEGVLDDEAETLDADEVVKQVERGFARLIRANASQPSHLFLLPVKERPFFPGQTLPVLLNKSLWNKTIEKVIDSKQRYIGIIFVDTDEHNKARPEDFAKTGTLIRIHDPKVKDDYIQLIAEGVCRFQISEWISESEPYHAHVTYPKEIRDGSETELKAYGLAIMNAFKELLPLNPLYSEELKFFLNRYSVS